MIRDDYVIVCGDFGVWHPDNTENGGSDGFRKRTLRCCLLTAITRTSTDFIATNLKSWISTEVKRTEFVKMFTTLCEDMF